MKTQQGVSAANLFTAWWLFKKVRSCSWNSYQGWYHYWSTQRNADWRLQVESGEGAHMNETLQIIFSCSHYMPVFDLSSGMGRGRPLSRQWSGCCLGLIRTKTLNHGERIHVWFNHIGLLMADTDTCEVVAIVMPAVFTNSLECKKHVLPPYMKYLTTQPCFVHMLSNCFIAVSLTAEGLHCCSSAPC